MNRDKFKRSFEDCMVINIFYLGVSLLKILKLVRIEENIDFYNHDKRTLRNHYKRVQIIYYNSLGWKLET